MPPKSEEANEAKKQRDAALAVWRRELQKLQALNRSGDGIREKQRALVASARASYERANDEYLDKIAAPRRIVLNEQASGSAGEPIPSKQTTG